MITVYSLENCPYCEEIKKRFTFHRIPFKEEPMDSVESITEMRCNNCFTFEAPVIRIDDEFMNYEEANKWIDKEYT